MNFYLENFLYFLGGFIIILLLNFWLYKREKKKLKNDNISVNLIIKRGNLDLKKTKYKTIYFISSMINSFIVSFTSVIIINVDNVFYKLLIGFALIMTLIYSLYDIAGKSLKKKEDTPKKQKIKKVKKEKKKRVKKNV